MRRSRLLAGLILSWMAATVAAQPPQARDALTAELLLAGRSPGLVHNGYFLPVGETRPAEHGLSGTLHFPETPMRTFHPDRIWSGSGCTLFPAFSLPLLSHGEHLIPVQRGIIPSGERQASYWNIIVSPGRIWQEPGDGGLSRASLPFTLTDNAVGQARNGIATFVFDAARVSAVAIQISQETAPQGDYPRVDFHGMIPASYTPHGIADRQQIESAFDRELALQVPLHAWSELPDAERSLEQFGGALPPSAVSAGALLMDGHLYLQSVPTRSQGPFPYPEAMRHGVFSVTKTLAMGVSLFHFAQRYGEAIFEEEVLEHVPELAAHPGWAGVTFGHALSMATGTGGRDEGELMLLFINGRSIAEKLAVVGLVDDPATAPGQSFNYASTNTFVLSCALQRYVRRREGEAADYWSIVREEVLGPLGIEHLPVARTVEPGGVPGVPVMGWGAYPTPNEAARLGQLLQDEGLFEGRQLLHREKVREALGRTELLGYDAGSGRAYLHSIWRLPVDTGSCRLQVPAMVGRGGNYVMLLPSGLTAVRFSDANQYDISPMVLAAESYRGSCP